MIKRIIINYDDSITDYEALSMVKAVVSGGKISGGLGKNRKQYCYITQFQDGITAHCPTRYKQKSERFDLWKT